DEQTFDKSNINRVYGSRLTDQGAPKVDLMSRLAADIGLGTVVETHHGSIVRPSVFRHLLDLDVVFGCTDGEWARSYLERLPTWYYVPVVDMGVMIDAPGGRLRSIQGRVTILQPGTACLSCRGRIEPARVRAESLSFTDPDEANKLRKEGYLEGLEEPAPSVVPFTTTIAATAVSELLHRITGFLGGERETSEVLQLFDSQRVRTNNRAGIRGCICTRRDRWGYGDRSLMMGMTWVEE
ncbi:MAG: ThiF family adenylyltransferase, partial [Dehalococcoidia bacterium]